MPLLKLMMILFGVVLLAVQGAGAETFSYPKKGAKFQLQLPPDWKVEQLPEGRYKFTSPSGAVTSILYSVTGDKDNAVNTLVAEAEVILKHDVKEPSILGGVFFPLRALEGIKAATQMTVKGLRPSDNRPINLYFVIFSPDERLWSLIHSIYPDGTPPQEQEELYRLIHSIKPA